MQQTLPVRAPSDECPFRAAAGDSVRDDKLPAQPTAAHPIAAGKAVTTLKPPVHTVDSQDVFQPAASILKSGAPDSTPTNGMLRQGAACATPAAPGAKSSSADSVVSRHMPSTFSADDAMPAPDDKARTGSTAEGPTSIVRSWTHEEKKAIGAGNAEWRRMKQELQAEIAAQHAEEKKKLLVMELQRRRELMDKEEAQARANADALLRQAWFACL